MKKVHNLPPLFDDPKSEGYKRVLDAYLAQPEEVDIVPPESLRHEDRQEERIA